MNVSYPDQIQIQPVDRPITATVRPPGSKSLTNRALICAALASGESQLTGALDSEDTRVMIASLDALGIKVASESDGETLVVQGCGGNIPIVEASLFVENSGTSMRFLTALVTLGHGTYHLDGIARMRERPIADLAAALKSLGANVQSKNGCPPVKVVAEGLEGGDTTIGGNISSQFLSALMMVAPYAKRDVRICVEGELVSVPYVEMTRAVMQSFGAELNLSDDCRKLEIATTSRYQGQPYAIEPDASAASYFFAAAAVTGGRVTVEGLSQESLQGDVAFCDCLDQMGCDVEYGLDSVTVQGRPLKGIDVDMNAISDTMQTLAVVALFAEGPTRVTNVEHVRHKETDRIAAVATELRKLGATVEEFADGLRITPAQSSEAQASGPGTEPTAAIDTYNDHRMAMSFAIAGLVRNDVVINHPGCVVKTYPRFFEDLGQLIS